MAVQWLHSFNFQFLLMFRPAWYIVVILLSVLGVIVPVSGVVVGSRYPRRQTWMPALALDSGSGRRQFAAAGKARHQSAPDHKIAPEDT
jgi:hypothetical protein